MSRMVENMNENSCQRVELKIEAYMAPVLTVYGTIENVTAGSEEGSGDTPFFATSAI